MHFIRPRRFIKRRLVDGKRKYFFLPFAFGLFLLVSSLSGLISTCSLSSCPPSSHPESSATHQQKSLSFLSDLNGVEICLSIKFVEPIQPLELEGSPQLGEEGPYHVVYNYLKSSRFYGVNETVTYTTHSTPELMRNVGAVSERWDGPVSVAIYVPSTDFCRAMHLLIFLRNCDIAAYREKVTWHLFWPKDYPPPSSWRLVPDETQVDCDKLANDYRHNTDLKMTWRVANKLPYPINVGRNIARQASTTWFVLPSDVELYPSLSLAPQFISFISGYNTKAVPSKLTPSRVFVVPVFEVKKTMPNKKEELMIQLARRTAVYFHKLTCAHCQKFPAIQTWITNAGIPGRIQAMHHTYREYPHHRWEPIFICTKREPLYEERLSWEGLQDKMTQMHEFCLRKYEFVILDRAFLVHSAGIKRRSNSRAAQQERWRDPFIAQNAEIYEQVLNSQDAGLGGHKKRCPHS